MSAPVCILHHHVGAETSFERGLAVTSTRAAYEAQINHLAKDNDVIDLDTLLSGKLPKRPLLMTFDDAFASVYDVAKEVLAPAGLPALFFVNPQLVNENGISLDSVITWVANQHGLEALCSALDLPLRAEVSDVVVGDMSQHGSVKRAEIKTRLLDAFGQPDFSDRAPLLTRAQLAELPSLGVEIGNHTATHVHCRSLSTEELNEEIVFAKAQLEDFTGAPVRSFSVPYGHENDLTPELVDVLRATGHDAIFLVHARSNLRRPAPDIWYRTSLQNQPPSALRAHLKTKPLLRTARQMLGV